MFFIFAALEVGSVPNLAPGATGDAQGIHPVPGKVNCSFDVFKARKFFGEANVVSRNFDTGGVNTVFVLASTMPRISGLYNILAFIFFKTLTCSHF